MFWIVIGFEIFFHFFPFYGKGVGEGVRLDYTFTRMQLFICCISLVICILTDHCCIVNDVEI